MVYVKIARRRTIRKFINKDVPEDILIRCVDAARLAPSGANRQPLKYIVVNDKDLLKSVFENLSWAGYLPKYYPSEDEMPRAYIIILIDKDIKQSSGHDAGIAAMCISMVAFDEGLGSCIMGAINRENLRKLLVVPANLDIVLVVSLGYPAESPVIEDMKDGRVEYWLDKDGTLHVPKRSLDEIIRWNS